MKIKIKKYRIITDNIHGYTIQIKYLLWPYWIDCWDYNSFTTIGQAKKALKLHKQGYDKEDAKDLLAGRKIFESKVVFKQ